MIIYVDKYSGLCRKVDEQIYQINNDKQIKIEETHSKYVNTATLRECRYVQILSQMIPHCFWGAASDSMDPIRPSPSKLMFIGSYWVLWGLIGSYWLPIDVCFSNSFFHSRQPAAPALFFLAFLTRCPLSFSRGLCFLVRTAPILQQALQFLSLEPSAQAVLANSSGLCVYLEQLAKP